MAGQRRIDEWDAPVAEQFPDRRPAPEVDRLGRHEGVGLDVTAQRDVGAIGLGVAAEEVEDAVAAGVDARGEGRPGHRRLRRGGRGDPARPAPITEEAEVRQVPGVEQRPDDRGFEPVQADHDHTFDGSSLPESPPGRDGQTTSGSDGGGGAIGDGGGAEISPLTTWAITVQRRMVDAV